MTAAPRLRSLFIATALLLAPGLAFAQALEENPEDTADVRIEAEVVAAVVVNSEQPEGIDLGYLLQGADLTVAPDPGDANAAQFSITGPANYNWELTVTPANLTHAGGDEITISLAGADDICFINDGSALDSANCVLVTSGTALDEADHDGAGDAFVGYQVDVPNDADEGIYENISALTLKAEALLGL